MSADGKSGQIILNYFWRRVLTAKDTKHTKKEITERRQAWDVFGNSPAFQSLVITHIFSAAASRLLLWLQKPRKYKELAMPLTDGSSLPNSDKPWLTVAPGSPHFVCFSSNCTTTACPTYQGCPHRLGALPIPFVFEAFAAIEAHLMQPQKRCG